VLICADGGNLRAVRANWQRTALGLCPIASHKVKLESNKRGRWVASLWLRVRSVVVRDRHGGPLMTILSFLRMVVPHPQYIAGTTSEPHHTVTPSVRKSF